MIKYLFILFSFLTFTVQAQTKKSGKPAPPPPPVQTDPLQVDSLAVEEEQHLVIHDFRVYTKKPKSKKERMKLCLNLVSGDSILNYCVNDSILRDPEVFKVLFQEKSGDTTFVLVFASAFSKVPEKIECGAGKESKLFFVRWNVKTGKAILKQRTIESCMKAITLMTIDPIVSWNGQTPLIVSYHKGGINFSELKFDPLAYRLGFQTVND